MKTFMVIIVSACASRHSAAKKQMLVIESTQATKTPPKRIPALKLTANASKNRRLKDEMIFFCMAYFQGRTAIFKGSLSKKYSRL